MWVLFLEIWVWLLIAFTAGWFFHWFFCCRGAPSTSNGDRPADPPADKAEAEIKDSST